MLTMTFQRSTQLNKRVYIEVIGGDADGIVLDSHSDDPAVRETVRGILFMTKNGEVGFGMNGISLSNLLELARGETREPRIVPDFMHKYVITERLDEAGEILLRMTYSTRRLPDPDAKPDQPEHP